MANALLGSHVSLEHTAPCPALTYRQLQTGRDRFTCLLLPLPASIPEEGVGAERAGETLL